MLLCVYLTTDFNATGVELTQYMLDMVNERLYFYDMFGSVLNKFKAEGTLNIISNLNLLKGQLVIMLEEEKNNIAV